MSYTKTNWVDNTTPIDKNNLNKIEQGIYDNSLVAEAVNSTVKPNESALAEAVEITEGQMTDVIGVNDILIKGQTSQDGEPTPSFPVDVNVVSGSNVINTNNKNLLPNNAQSITKNGVTFTVNKDKSIKINGTASANTDIYLFGGTTDTGNYLHFPKGTYSLSTPDSKFYYIAREKTKGALVGNSSILQALASDDCYFYGFFIRANQNSVFNNFVIKPQLEKGSTATTYELHQGKELHLDLGSIELCKIGDYQDYFYKDNSKWYLHKEIRKVILDGSESWNFVDNTEYSNSILRFSTSVENKKEAASLSTATPDLLFCDKFKISYINYEARTIEAIAGHPTTSQNIGLFIDKARLNTEDVSGLKTWLASNNVTVYYVLAIATDTEIIGILKEQLEAIYNAPLYEQTNITQTNNDLPMILDITACKDNINGIKAWIRR